MPYGKRKYGKRYKKRGKTYKKGIPNKALHGKVDTVLERRMQSIAQKEARALLVPLVFRRFFGWGTGTSLGPVSFDYSDKGIPIPLEGFQLEMQQIPVRGSSVLGATNPANGTRGTNVIKIYAITVGIRVEFENFDQSQNPSYSGNSLHWAVVGCRTKLNAYMDSTQIPAPVDGTTPVLPLVQRTILLQDHRIRAGDLLPLTPWGYSERLDNVFEPLPQTAVPLNKNPYNSQGKYAWKKSFARGIVSSKYGTDIQAPKVKKFTKFIRLKKPLTMNYVQRAGLGGQINGPMKLFLVLRSQIPMNAMGGIDEEFLPKCCGFYKVHYYDS